MNIQFNTPIFFTRDDIYSDLFCEMIDKQHGHCCDGYIDEGYISNCFDEFTHGYMILSESNQENKHFRGQQFFLRAFILFEYRREQVGRTPNIEGVIRGKVICCNPLNKGLGIILLNKVKEFALVRDVKRWIIFSLPYDTLIAYYKRYGFSQRKLIHYNNGNLKTVLMSIHFGYGIDLYDYDKNDGTCFEFPYLTENNIPNNEENENKFINLFADGV
jgi:hypothetical protein